MILVRRTWKFECTPMSEISHESGVVSDRICAYYELHTQGKSLMKYF